MREIARSYNITRSTIFEAHDIMSMSASEEPSGPSMATMKRLFAHSRNRCAFPKCTAALTHGATVTGEICHIKGRPNGPRYDPQQRAGDRHGFDNLILLCPIHHTVIDADPEAYTVERLVKMKNDHERGAAPMSEEEAAAGARLLLFNQPVTTMNQSGGITAQTVSAHKIQIDARPLDRASDARMVEATEKLWNILHSLNHQFGGLTFIELILLPEEIGSYFTTGRGNEIFDSAQEYRKVDCVFEKFKACGADDAEKLRLFVTDRLWQLFFAIRAMYGRIGSLYAASFDQKQYKDWRQDQVFLTNVRAVLQDDFIEAARQRPIQGLQMLFTSLDTAFLQEARSSLASHTSLRQG